MGLTIITGPANAGKTGALLERLVALAGTEGVPVLVVPQAPDADRARQLLARMSLTGIKVVPIDMWIDELWRSHGDGRRVVSPSQRAALMDEALSRTRFEGMMAESANSPGFVRLACAVAAIALSVGGRQRTGSEAQMSALLESYFGLLAERDLIERSQAASTLASAPLDVGGPVAFNHFTDLAAHQEALLIGLARAQEVLVSLTWQEGRAATECATPLVRRLLCAGGRLEHVAGRAGWTDPGLADLAENLYEGRATLAGTPALDVIEAEGTHAELGAVVEAVRGALSEGYRPGRIAIAVRASEELALPLTERLAEAGVPVALDVALPLPATPFGKALLSLVGAAVSPSRREPLLAYLLSPYAEAHGDEVSELDEAWRRRGQRADPIREAAARFPKDAALQAMLALTDGRSSTDRWEKWKIVADSLRRTSALRQDLSGLPALLDSRAHGAVVSALSELAEAGLPLSADRVIDALRTTIVATGMPVGDRVLVTEAHRLRGRRFDMVVIAGLDAERFAPAAEVPLAERVSAAFGGRPPRDLLAADRLLFYLLITRAARRLVVSRRAVDGIGREVPPSPLFEELLDVYRTPDEAADGALPAGIAIRRVGAGSAERVGAGAAPPVEQRAMPLPTIPGARGRLTDEGLLAALAGRDEFSASEIETYLSCPYRWFVRSVLAPREIDEELDARARGTAAHALLALFYEHWVSEGHERVTPANLDEALELLEHIARGPRAPWRQLGDDAAAEIVAQRACAEARAVIADDARFLPGFCPVGHEVRFGASQGARVAIGGVYLKGSMDRIDASESGVVVIDYKSTPGRDLVGRRSFSRSGRVQLPVYALAARELTGAPVLAAVYRSTRSLSCRGFWVDGAIERGNRFVDHDRVDERGLAEVIEEAVGLISVAVEGIREGRIPRQPRTRSQCARCDAAPVCGGAP